MKKLFFIMGVLCLVNLATAQTKLGLKASYSTSMSKNKMHELDNGRDHIDYNFKFTGQSNVVSFGISAKTELGQFFFDKDFMFRQSTNTFDLEDFTVRDAVYMRSVKETFSQIHMPISAGVQLGNIRLGAGPIFNYALDIDRSQELTSAFVIKDRKLSTGFQFLTGIQVNRFISLDVKYEFGLGSVGDGYYYNYEKVNFRTMPNMFTIGLGVFY